ncbi:hypothetical protein CLAVI_000538 [Candidatus Clavichlamydia salmonicola]|uniref:hypothetical protein n=1 Tax=Candidatus Clavichlamydia salmonicola TaxID=469812 RepID=UPI0018910FDA|nr:hypothetical protein [Candidatus Clavichlamydia salmonicola]MBF5050916.1 hypothetical protein [Candidatus Clavichlamydia salmonicola]
MSFIYNYLGLTPPRSMSEIVRNCRHNMSRLCNSHIMRAAAASTMSISMAFLTTQIFAGNPLSDDHHSLNSNWYPEMRQIKISALSILTAANTIILINALYFVHTHNNLAPLHPETPTVMPRLYGAIICDLSASALGIIATCNFILSTYTESPSVNSLQAFAITFGSGSSLMYTLDAIISCLICYDRAISRIYEEDTRNEWQFIDPSDDEENLLSLSIDSGLGIGSDDNFLPSRSSTSTLVEID